MDKRFKKFVFIITLYFVYIKFFNGYYPYFPSIPIYPNNSQDLAKTKLAMANRTPQDVQFFFLKNPSIHHKSFQVLLSFYPYLILNNSTNISSSNYF